MLNIKLEKKKMKKNKLCGVFAVASVLMLLTSCLGDGSRVQTFGSMAGVMSYPDNMSYFNLMACTSNYPANEFVTASVFDKGDLAEGACVIMNNVNIDYGTPENSNAGTTGIYTATVGSYEEISKIAVYPGLRDTSKLADNEQIVNDIQVPVSAGSYFIKNYLFLSLVFPNSTDQRTAWSMSFDPSATPTQENGERIYSIFLRAEVGSGSAKDDAVAKAFDMGSFMNLIGSQEAAKDKDGVYFRIYYVKSVDKDKSKITWASSPIIGVPIKKASSL